MNLPMLSVLPPTLNYYNYSASEEGMDLDLGMDLVDSEVVGRVGRVDNMVVRAGFGCPSLVSCRLVR